ncbi:hypothetical protein B4U79_03026 [Dinothrombium tinctorium]|uniref:Uncharacterized protein n=1 Tax=Dinothrombium tinctorium TaxID=1965070 RepID=A0A443QKW9_9ACAR|nr:hypothetical protein B4U79_03026 [Dinothrombium tinctorium]
MEKTSEEDVVVAYCPNDNHQPYMFLAVAAIDAVYTRCLYESPLCNYFLKQDVRFLKNHFDEEGFFKTGDADFYDEDD